MSDRDRIRTITVDPTTPVTEEEVERVLREAFGRRRLAPGNAESFNINVKVIPDIGPKPSPTEAAESTARGLLDDEGRIERRIWNHRRGEGRRGAFHRPNFTQTFHVPRSMLDDDHFGPWGPERLQAERLPFWKRVRAKVLDWAGLS